MKKILNFILLLFLLLSFFVVGYKSNKVYASDGSYYNSLDTTKDGEQFKSSLNDIISSGVVRKTYTQVWEVLKAADEDPNNTDNVILLYTGLSREKSKQQGSDGQTADRWNREHVWAKSHGFPKDVTSNYGFTDCHHLRAADVVTNSTRNNLDFDEVSNYALTYRSDSYGNKWNSECFEPRDEVKGDVARMLFYMAVRYEGEGSDPDLEFVDTIPSVTVSENSTVGYIGKYQTILKWHYDDPVDESELTRNDVVYSYQHNRNPFIDHPEWVVKIWDNDYSSSEDINNIKVEEAITKINAIGKVTSLKETLINTAFEAYNTLNTSEKELVTNYKKLSNALNTINVIKNNGHTLEYDGLFLNSEKEDGDFASTYANDVDFTINGQPWFISSLYRLGTEFRFGTNIASVANKYKELLSLDNNSSYLEMHFDIESSKKIEFSIDEAKSSYGMPANWYIVYSTDKGSTWRIGTNGSDFTNISFELTSSTTCRFALIIEAEGYPRIPLKEVKIYKYNTENQTILDIASLPDIQNENFYNELNNVLNEYCLLTGVNKMKITNYDDLLACQNEYNEINKVNNLISLINSIGTVKYSYSVYQKINQAEEIYESLSSTDKNNITNYSTLTNAKSTYSGLQKNINARIVNIKLVGYLFGDTNEVVVDSSSNNITSNTININHNYPGNLVAIVNRNKVVSRSSYNTIASSEDEVYTAYYVADGYKMVMVIDESDKLLGFDIVSTSSSISSSNLGLITDSIVAPTGYEFDKLYLDDTEFDTSSLITENLIIKARYKKTSTDQYNVCVTNGTVSSFTCNFDEQVTVTSSLNDFDHWEIDNKVVSYDKTYKFSVYSNITIKASNTIVEKNPLIRTYPSSMEEIKIVGFYLPSGCTLVETGVLLNSDNFDTATKKIIARKVSNINEYAIKTNQTATPYLVYCKNNEYNIVYNNGSIVEDDTPVGGHVIINQVYGAGGNSGCVYSNDFVELYNPTNSDVNLNGWTIQYASATKNFGGNNCTLNGTIKAHGYYLIQCAGSTGSNSLPTANITCSINMSATKFKVVLANSSITVTAEDNAHVVDFVGCGTADQFEGEVAVAPSTTKSIIRISFVDTDNNKNDFIAATPVLQSNYIN